MKQLKAKYKYLQSFLKTNWTFSDYPLEFWENHNAKHDDIKFAAKFTNWPLFISYGITLENAIKGLKENFIKYEKNNILPRPGINAPIQFAKTERIEKYENIGTEFFDKILGVDYLDHFVSDKSILFDVDFEKQGTFERIEKEYGIKVTEDNFIVDIFEQIGKKENTK